MPKLNSFSTAIDALRGQDLTGKVAVVTGGNSGIGAEMVRALAIGGAKVYLTGRNINAAEKVAKDIRNQGVKGQVEVAQLDLSDLKNVHKFSDYVISKEKHLNYLICNAGLVPGGFRKSKQGVELTMAVNHFGHVAIVEDLLEIMGTNKKESDRIVIVSSAGYIAGQIDTTNINYQNSWFYTPGKAYVDSKYANVLHAKALAKSLQGSNIQVFSLHPGGIMTGLPRYFGGAVYDFVRQNSDFFNNILIVASRGEWKNCEQGAATAIYAATAPELEPFSGSYLANCQIQDLWYHARDQAKADRFYEWSKNFNRQIEKGSS